MTAVPLGQGAYRRLYAGTPEVILLNRWLEANPANLREHTSVLARPGTTPLLQLNPGSFTGIPVIRGNYSLDGLFNDSLFVVSGQNLYRINQDMSVTPISGIVNGYGHPEVAWQKGAGYERLWISDGTLLQFYDGTTAAKGSITLNPPVTPGTDVFQVGGVYYTWGTSFSSSDAGTVSHPFKINPNTQTGPLDPMGQLILALNAAGTQGIDYSSTIGGQNTLVSGSAALNGITAITITNGGTGYTGTPTVTITDPLGSSATAHAVLSGGTIGTIVVDTQGFNYSANPTVTISGTGTGAAATATVGTPTTTTTVVLTARVQGTSGNSISLSVTGGTALSVSGAYLANGGIDVLQGCIVPVGVPLSLTQVSSYILVSIAGTQQFYWINPGEVTIDPLNFASKESSPDPIIALRTIGDQVGVIGSKSFENWYATGNSLSPFAPIEGRVYERGTLDGTAVVIDDAIILVGNDGRVYSIGYQYGDSTDVQWGVNRISDNGIEERVRRQVRREQGLTP